MKHKLHLVLFLFLCVLALLTAMNCSANDPEILQSEFRLTAVDVSVTEAFIAVNTSVFSKGEIIEISRYDKPALSFISTGHDTIIMDTNLSQNTTYSYSARATLRGHTAGASNQITLTTLSPSSHTITWQLYEFGDFSINELWDVTIVDENDIWAVGEITLTADNVNGFEKRNLVHWDGQNCTMSLVYTKDYLGPGTISDSSIGVLTSILSFSKDNIWISDFANLNKWDGSEFIHKVLFSKGISGSYNSQVYHIGGTDEDNIYCVGAYGTIMHYKGNGRWNKLSTGTDACIDDIWPYRDILTGDYRYLCPVTNIFSGGERMVLEVDSRDNVHERSWLSDQRIASMWTRNGFPIFACGDGIYSNKRGHWESIHNDYPYYTNMIRGNGLNDIFVGGDFGLLTHYNGIGWHVYTEFLYPVISIINSIDVKGNTIAVAGTGNRSSKAVLLIGKRR